MSAENVITKQNTIMAKTQPTWVVIKLKQKFIVKA